MQERRRGWRRNGAGNGWRSVGEGLVQGLEWEAEVRRGRGVLWERMVRDTMYTVVHGVYGREKRRVEERWRGDGGGDGGGVLEENGGGVLERSGRGVGNMYGGETHCRGS